MATSGTYSWSPELVEIYDEAFERCGVPLETLTGRHLRAARRSMEFMLSAMANIGILLWAVDQQTQLLTEAVPTYNTPVGTIAILDMVLRRNGLDVNVFPMQRDEYLAIPSKTQEGLPSRYYFDRQETTPTITLWSNPILSTDQIIYYRLRRLQDAGDATNTLDVPYRWQETMCAGLAARVAVKFAPDKYQLLKGDYEQHLRMALQEDRQRSPTMIRPKFGMRR